MHGSGIGDIIPYLILKLNESGVSAIVISKGEIAGMYDNIMWQWELLKQKLREWNKMRKFMDEVKWVI